MELYAYLGGALSIGLGAIGAGYGIGMAASEATKAITRQPNASGKITKVMLVGQAVTESPAIFALLIALFLVFKVYHVPEQITLANIAGLLAAGICMGFGAMGPGVGSGMANASACTGMGVQPENENAIMRTMLIGQAVSQSTSVYALVISMLLLFVI